MDGEVRSPNGVDGRAGLTWELDLAGSDPGALILVRRWAATELADLSGDQLADVMLVAVELATNAYEHGGAPLAVRMTRFNARHVIRIEVDDTNTDQITLGNSRFAGSADRGRGLVLVDKICERWGVSCHTGTGTKTVWAEVILA